MVNWLIRYISERSGIRVCFVSYQVMQVMILLLASIFRKPLRRRSPGLRLWACLILGLGLGCINLGKSTVHLCVLPMLLFCLLKNFPLRYAGHLSLCVSMLYLWFVDLNCITHREIRRILVSYLMNIVQKASSLGYCLQDRALGREVNPHLSGRAKSPCAWFDRIPSPLKYFSFLLEFCTLPYGPPIFYADYMNFIEETDFKDPKCKDGRWPPSPVRAVIGKLSGVILIFVMYKSLIKYYSFSTLSRITNAASEIHDWSPLYLIWYAYVACGVNRMIFYITFLNTEAACNNAGMGFSGFSTAGTPKWNGLTNYDVIKHELGLSWQTSVAAWNTRTHAWLRGVAYDRGATRWRTARTYTLSALWHGASVGYVCTFYTGILFTLAARKLRAVIRPLFLDSKIKKFFYDLCTLVATQAALTYALTPFHLLNLKPILAFYGKFYYIPHIVALILIALFYKKKSK